MRWIESEYLIPLNEWSGESNAFHATNLFASELEEMYKLSTRAEAAIDDVVTNMFLEDAMSDKVSNAEQNLLITHACQPNTSEASSDSADLTKGTSKNQP